MDDAQVVLLPRRDGGRAGGKSFDAASRGARTKAPRKRHGHCAVASNAVVRSKPNAMLKHSTPWPDAPLTRLSRAAVTTALSPCAATLTRQRLEWLTSLVVGVRSTTLVNGWSA